VQAERWQTIPGDAGSYLVERFDSKAPPVTLDLHR
jgi:hypothetical protein